jgi:thiol-disulfide isomerase/thioredoxin
LLKRAILVVGLVLFSTLATAADGFSVRDLQGKTHTLAGYKGKWVLVNFWATWCPPCLEEIPDLVALHDKHKDKDLVVIGIAMDYRNPKQVAEFADQNMISYPVVLGTSQVTSQIGVVEGLPTTYLYNPQGKKVAYHVGALTRQAIESYISGKR